jgi:hypothetical protein
MAERASVFDSADDFDVGDFAPKRPKSDPKSEAAPDAVRAVSEASSFRSRDPVAAKAEEPPRREPRRYRTGRNVQLNVKVRAETLDAFHAIADAQGWVLGETLERAVAALEREIAETSAI